MKVVPQSVELIGHYGDDLLVVNAARASFDKQHEEFEDTGDTRLIKYLARENHFMPFCHPHVTFRVKAPIFVARQLAKHQIGLSWSEVSRRYIQSEPEFYFPEYWRAKAENVKQGSSEDQVKFDGIGYVDRDRSGPELIQFMGFEPLIQNCLKTYQGMLSLGICPEQARMVLPQNTMTTWVWTGSLQAWARVCQLRLDSHTQKETRDVAEKISAEMSKLYPVSWKALMEIK